MPVRIACVGIAVLDHVFRLDELPRAPRKHLARGLATVLGGMAANAVFGGHRMGPIFGGMLLSGKKVAQDILARLG